MLALAKREVRERLVGIIQKAKDYDSKALKVLEGLYVTLESMEKTKI